MALPTDLLGLDSDVARAARDPSLLRSRLRHVAGKTTLDELRALTASAHEAPLRDALVRWVYALTDRRIGAELEDDEREARDAPNGRYEGEPPRMVSFREAMRGIVSAKNAAAAAPWLSSAVDAAPKIAAVARERAEQRLEVARRLGLAHPSELLSPAPFAKVQAAAEDFLARTDDLASYVLRESLERHMKPSFLDAILIATARDAGDGWPPRLVPRWLEELFGAGTRGLAIELPPMPATLGAASFARALASFGFALREAMAPRGLPFAIAHEPWPLASHRLEHVLGALPSSVDFQVVALKTSRRVALAQARALARTALWSARLDAARTLLADEARFAPLDRFEELSARLYGAALPRALAGAWPSPREGEPARFAALVSAPCLERDLVDRFDVDWFRNPRSFPHLRALAAGPAREEAPSLDASAVAALARAFEEKLA